MKLSQDVYELLVSIHSIGRWVVLLLLLFAIFNHLIAGKRPYIGSDAKTGLFLTVTADIMLLIGLVLYFAGPWGYQQIAENGMGAAMKNPTSRFYGIEHLVGMIIAIALLHIGKVQGKKSISDRAKHRRSLIFYSLALLIILVTIPWPFREVGAGRGWY
jgi:hypothetical protein